MTKTQDAGAKWGIAGVTADGNFMYRTIYSLMGQQDGELMTNGEFLAGDNRTKNAECAAGDLQIGPKAGSSRPIRIILQLLHCLPLVQRR